MIYIYISYIYIYIYISYMIWYTVYHIDDNKTTLLCSIFSVSYVSYGTQYTYTRTSYHVISSLLLRSTVASFSPVALLSCSLYSCAVSYYHVSYQIPGYGTVYTVQVCRTVSYHSRYRYSMNCTIALPYVRTAVTYLFSFPWGAMSARCYADGC